MLRYKSAVADFINILSLKSIIIQIFVIKITGRMILTFSNYDFNPCTDYNENTMLVWDFRDLCP